MRGIIINFHEIKFKFDINLTDRLDDIFQTAGSMVNVRFDGNLKPYVSDDNVMYDFLSVSHLNQEDIEKEINLFFNFAFKEIIDVPLYKFLVLKSNEKFTILVNINSLIFDYASINDFYNVFKNNHVVENNILDYYENLDLYLNSSSFEDDRAYWKKCLENSGDHVKFFKSNASNYKNVEISFDNEKLTDFLKEDNISKFNFFTAIFALYLSRVDRTKGCLLKTALSNDNYFDNDTLLKITYSPDISFADFLEDVRDVYNSSCQHAKVDIDYYIEEELSYYSIYDFTGIDEVSVINGQSCALTLNIYEDYLDLKYDCDLFSEIYMHHMAKNMESMIDGVADCPAQLLKDVNILSKQEENLLQDFCKGKEDYVDEEGVLSGFFRSHAINNPEAVAVDDGVNQVSYGDLEKSSNSIANDLAKNHNVTLGSHVAILLPRTYHFPEVVLALNKLGAAFIPIDVIYPVRRIEHMLNISESDCIITTKELSARFDFNVDVVCLEDLSSDDDVDVEIMSKSEDLFAIMFTSGTTGLPKGVMISNHQMAGLYVSFKNIFNFSYGDVIGCYLGFSFVASFVIYVTLVYGGCSRIFNENEQKDILSLISILKQNPMNSLILPPAVAIPILQHGDLKLDYLVSAGAKLNELYEKEMHTQLINFYGTTEIVFGITKNYDINDIEANNVSIGRPVTNNSAYILDADDNQMPIGVSGEICISSRYLSPGYYNSPELTAKAFVDDPFCESKKMYRTGDIGLYNFDGEIEIIGREDDQLSVRGFRIESEEILSIVKGFEEIRDVYLDVDHDTLIMYYTKNSQMDVNLVKDALLDGLPGYMVPSLFIELDEIPLNMNGKIDKMALKNMSEVKSEIEINDDVLVFVIDAFKEVLGKEFILVEDNFIELGGNSLSAMKLQLLLNEKLSANISASMIMELSTPADIADYIKLNSDVCAPIAVKYTFEDKIPLSNSQLNVYLDEMVNDTGTQYNNPFKIELGNNYSVDEIKQALIKLGNAYPILKMRIIIEKGEPKCIFDGKMDIRQGSLNDLESFVRHFELDKSLSRFLIIDDGGLEYLCCDFHHILFDGTSFEILFRELYSILNNGGSDFVDDGVLRQISFEEGINEDYEMEARKFFEGMLADKDEAHDLLHSITKSNVTTCKSDNDGGEDTHRQDAQHGFSDILEIDNDELSSFLQSNRITHNQFFASAFAYTLSRFTGSPKVLFNLIEDGRRHMELSRSVGMYVKTLPMLIDCTNGDVSSYLNYSSDLINYAMNYDLYPYHVLANDYELNIGIFFQYAHNIFSNISKQQKYGFKVAELRHDVNSDLSFVISDFDENKFVMGLLFSDKFSKDFIKQFTDCYKRILTEMIGSNTLGEINYTGSADLNLLDSYNETSHDLEYGDILEAFNKNLAKSPDSPLVTYVENSYTYAEVAFIADRIANSLKSLDIGFQDSVAFLVERSEYYMFSILGILSVGAIYVPLDDTHPDDHLSFILEDVNAGVVLVSDETYNRAKDLAGTHAVFLNISDILKGELGKLSSLSACYGDLACILYTSGTTGIPKGVKITRKSIINFSEMYVGKYALSGNDIFGLFASIGFDVAMEAIFASICAGACLNVVPNDIKFNMGALNQYFIKNKVTYTHLPAQVAKLFITQNNDYSLKVLCTGGEKLGEIETKVNCRFVDSYGPTETFVDVTSIDVDSKCDVSSIGHLFNNIKAYILDDEFRRVPPGAVGELYLAGYQIAEGYLNRYDETNHVFLKNPFSDDEAYDVMYRTGDMVRFLPDGSLGIVGRRDSQVKIRGNRVELSEVASEIGKIDYIEDVSVQTIKIGSNNELVAYVVVSNDLDGEELKNKLCTHVSEHKPDYMIPSFVVRLDEIPLNVNGKVDRHALPQVDMVSLHEDYVAPRNEKEKAVVEAFEKVFDSGRVGINDDFVRLGGDSLSAIKLVHYLEDCDVVMADILSLRTPAAIAKNIDDVSFDLDIYSLESPCPMNGAQINVFADVIIYNKRNAYHIPSYINVPKKYALEDIIEALNKLFDVHPILGMHLSKDYEENDAEDMGNLDLLTDLIKLGKKLGIGKMLDVINAFGLSNVGGIYNMIKTVIRLIKGDYPYLVKGQRPQILVESKFDRDVIADFFSESFDIYNNLSKFMIMESDDSYHLFSMVHHLIFDAASVGVFRQDFWRLLDGGSIDLDDTFLKASAYTHQIKNTPKFDEASGFFDSYMADVGDVGLLAEDNSSRGYNMSSYDLEFDMQAFKTFLNNEGISENVFFTGVFAYTLSKFVEGDKALFTMIENGRDRFSENFIGMTSNVMPLVVDCKDQSIDSFMRNTADMVYGVMKYSYYPVLLLYLKYNFEIKILFQYVPNWLLNEIDDIGDIGASQIINIVMDSYEDFLSELFVQVHQVGDGYRLVFMNSNKYSDGMIRDFKDTFESILSKIINSDSSSNLSLL